MDNQNFPYQLRHLHFSYSLEYTFKPKESVFKRMPNKEKFNRNNRYEMIFLINALQKLWGLSSLEDCEKIEYLIKTCMPESTNTQLEITDWLVLNWNLHSRPMAINAM